MVLVQTCCCGCTLAQGTVGTGIYSTVEATILLVVGALAMMYLNQPDIELDEELTKDTLEIYGIGCVIVGSFVLVASVLLFFAVQMKNRRLLLPWLIFRSIELFYDIGMIAFLFIKGEIRSAGGIQIVESGIYGYLFVVVLSYYQSDMSRSLTRSGTVLTPPPEEDPSPNSQPFEDSKHVVPIGPLPPAKPNAYPILQPTVTLFPIRHGPPNNVVSPLNPKNSYLRPLDPSQAHDQPPPYTPSA